MLLDRLSRGAARRVLASLALLALGCAPSVLHAQTPDYAEHLKARRWLPALAAVESLATTQRAYLQEVGRVRSLLGDAEGALRAFESAFGRDSVPPLPASSRLDSTEAHEALSAIVERARGRRLVILNEAHHDASARAFAAEVAHALRPLGFRYLACEALDPRDSAMAALGHDGRVSYASGIYTQEPAFAEFLRAALAEGYEPVGYEALFAPRVGDYVTDYNVRDSLQAALLLERTFARDTAARVLVYCGYAHAMEAPQRFPDGREVRALAARLAALTGTDPLTIDQSQQLAPSIAERGTSSWRYAVAHGWLRYPRTSFHSADGARAFVGGEYRDQVDLQVFHAPAAPVRGRPGWLAGAGGRKPVDIPAALLPHAGRAVVEAYRADEPDGVVAADRVIVSAAATPPALFLPPGRYVLVAQDAAGQPAGRKELRVR